jgi:predicted dehydrogenase
MGNGCGEDAEFVLHGALIGFGNVALYAHLPMWRKSRNFRIDAVVEPAPERARLVGEHLPEARVYSNIEAMLAENHLDFVDICTPPCFHADQMVVSVRSGLHVFCEKPMVTTPEALADIRGAVRDFGRVVFTVNNWKYAPIWAKTLDLVRGGLIGAVKSISLTVLRMPGSGGGASDWRRSAPVAGGGILLDHGWHNLYLALALVDSPPRAVSARMGYLDGAQGLEDEVDLAIRFSDAAARLHLTWRADCRKNLGLIAGDRGTISVNDDHLVVNIDGMPSERIDFSQSLSAGSHHLDWMLPVMEAFYREIVDPGTRGINFDEAAWCASLIGHAYRSQEQGSAFLSLENPPGGEVS